MSQESEQIEKAVAIENRWHEVMLTILNDKDFMRGVLESQRQEAAGVQGEPWSLVKARLGLD
jgi:hypothetical protein